MLLLSVVVSCVRQAPPVPVAPTEDPIAVNPASVGVSSPALVALLDEHWDAMMKRFPSWASELGDRRFDTELFDPSPEARAEWEVRERGWLTRARGLDGLAPADALTRDLLVAQIEGGLATNICESEALEHLCAFQRPRECKSTGGGGTPRERHRRGRPSRALSETAGIDRCGVREPPKRAC